MLQARGLADLLAEEDRLEVVDSRVLSGSVFPGWTSLPDVVVAIRLSPAQIQQGSAPVILLSDAPNDEGTFIRGIRAWLPLNAPATEIVAAIIAAANDLYSLTPDQVRRWLRNSAGDDEQGNLTEALTARESEVLRMLADGLANKEIAAQLGISEHTAKFHVAQILAKLRAASRTEAVALGIRRGLVPI